MEWWAPADPEAFETIRGQLSPGALRPPALGQWGGHKIKALTDSDLLVIRAWCLEPVEADVRNG